MQWVSGTTHSPYIVQSIKNGIRLSRQVVRLVLPAQEPADIGEPGHNLYGLGMPGAEYCEAVRDRGPVRMLGCGESSLALIQIGKAHMEPASRNPGSACMPRAENPDTKLLRRLVTALAAVKIDETHGDHRRIYAVDARKLFRGRDGGAIEGFRGTKVPQAAGGDSRAVQMDGIFGFYLRAAAKGESRTGEIAFSEGLAAFRQ